MAKIKDETVVSYLMSKYDISQEEAWFAAQEMLQTDKEEAPEKTPRKPTEWLVVVSDPNGLLPKNVMGFVINKKEIMRDEKMRLTEEPRMWGDEEAGVILKHAFARTADKVKGIPTFLNHLHAAKKLLKDEYGFEIKSKEGCYIAPVDLATLRLKPDCDPNSLDETAAGLKRNLEKNGVKNVAVTISDEDDIQL